MVGGPSATMPPKFGTVSRLNSERKQTGASSSQSSRLIFSHWHIHILLVDSVGYLNRHSICYVESAVYKFNQYNTIQSANIMLTTLYWILGLAFLAIDVFKWPKWTQKYKVQPGTNEIIDKKRLFTIIIFYLSN